MNGSLRSRLAHRFSTTVALGMASVSLVGWLALRSILDGELDSSLLSVASIQAASVTDSPDGEMHFHEWDLTPEEAASVRDLNRFAQVWSSSGASLLRTRYITQDLPVDGEALARAVAGEIVWVEQRFDGIPIRSLFIPLSRRGVAHEGHVLQVAAPLEVRNATLAAVAVFLSLIAVLTVAGTWLGGWWLAGSAVKPVQAIIEQAQEIEGGTLDRRIGAYAETSEYRGLVEVLNTMLERLQSSFQAQRRFTHDASHELRGPLTAMRGELEVALRRPRSPTEYRRVLESVLEEVGRLARTSEELLSLARTDNQSAAPDLQLRPLGEAVTVAVEHIGALFDEQGVALHTTDVASVDLPYDLDLMVRLIWNLLDNALEHTPSGGRVVVGVRVEGDTAILEVGDSGPGVATEYRDQIFQRFFRADPARGPRPGGRQGTGLGLPIVRTVAQAHGGDVHVAESPLGGALFTVRLPVRPLSP